MLQDMAELTDGGVRRAGQRTGRPRQIIRPDPRGIGETVEYMPSSRRRWKHCWSAQFGLRRLEFKTASCDIE